MATFKKPESIIATAGWCPGCGHGIVQRLIAESIEELGLQDGVLASVDIACAFWSEDAMDYEFIAGPHGRCASVATGMKRVRPDKTVYVHAGDGCSYVIGLAETSYAAIRDVPITMIVVNNGIFGMTGGQMNLATTLLGDKTLSSKKGRKAETMGRPVDIYNLVSYAYGSIVADRVWALEGVPAKGMTNEILKQFSATAASSGGIALFHMIGVTPEAQTKEQAFGGKEPKEVVEIHLSDLAEAERQITNPDVTDIDAVVLGCPHCSYNECARVEELLRGRHVNDHVKFWLITARSVLDRLKDSGLYERLIRLGVEIYCDGCILEYRNKNLGTNTMMSNSGKFDTYCFAMRGLQPVFGSMRECIESAVAGKVVKEAKPWRK